MKEVLIKTSHEHLLLLCSRQYLKLARFQCVKNKAYCKRFLNIVTLPPNFAATLAVIPPSQLGVSMPEPFDDWGSSGLLR